jgi:hypothetical protein
LAGDNKFCVFGVTDTDLNSIGASYTGQSIESFSVPEPCSAVLVGFGPLMVGTDAHNLMRRFRLRADAILRFIADPTVPFSNNLAERAVRMPKVKQKISGCFRTIAGADNFSIIRSCLDTLRKQGHGMLEVLRRAFTGDPIRPAA